MTIISGTSAATFLSNNFCEHTGIGFVILQQGLQVKDCRWFSQWQNNSGNFYSVDNIGDYTKAGIINTVIY
jgi:hypothetical protein